VSSIWRITPHSHRRSRPAARRPGRRRASGALDEAEASQGRRTCLRRNRLLYNRAHRPAELPCETSLGGALIRDSFFSGALAPGAAYYAPSYGPASSQPACSGARFGPSSSRRFASRQLEADRLFFPAANHPEPQRNGLKYTDPTR
jgi:hypothetical protein